MAVRIDKTVSQNESVANNLATLQSYLLRRAGRKLNDVEYIGLLRNNALGDLQDPGAALKNILEYITRVDDAGEIAIYGTYKPEDFEITRKFVDNEITSSFLRPLRDISIAGGAAGAEVATNPRIRIQDRTNLLDSFAGKGSISGLGKGPTALFYRTKKGKLDTVGTIVFTNGFDLTTGVVTSPNITLDASKTTAQFNGLKSAFLITSYTNANTGIEVSLVGTGLFLEYDATTMPGGSLVIKTGNDASLARLKELRTILGDVAFNSTVFTIKREYSAITRPNWFRYSPGADKAAGAAAPLPGGPDDFNPATSDSVVYFERGRFKLYSEPEYYNSGAYVSGRIPEGDRNAYTGDNITKDSNMRFLDTPRVIDSNVYNWGVRWDGYIRLDKTANARKYIFEVETNTAIKIDIYDGAVNLGTKTIDASKWKKVFDSSYGTVQNLVNTNTSGSSRFAQEEDRFISKRSFTLDGIQADTGQKTFRYDTALDGSTQVRYVPISIRMWNGGNDKIDPEQELFEVPLEPNLFLKYAYSETNATTQDEFFAGEFNIILATNNTDATVNDVPGQTFINAVLGETDAKVSYTLVKKTTTEDVTFVNEDGNDETVTVTTESDITPINITWTAASTNSTNLDIDTATNANGDDIKSTLTDGATVLYTVRVTPDRTGYSYTTLWSTNIIGPKQQDYQGYADLLGGETYTQSVPNYIEPLTDKLTLDQRPEWFKVSNGNRFLFGEPVTKDNDPLDGFKSNTFSGVIKSAESPSQSYVGLYGDGATPRVFSSRQNIIFGEAAYSGDPVSSNYLGLRLTSNFLGEGGKLIFSGIPINNSKFDWSGETGNQNKALAANDLGGGTNDKTAINAQLTERSDTLYWDGPEAGGTLFENSGFFFLHNNLGAGTGPVIAQDNPNTNGLPSFAGADDAIWAQPVIIQVTSAAGNKFDAPLTLGVQKVIYDRSGTASSNARIFTDTTNATHYTDATKTTLNSPKVFLLAFTTSFEPAYDSDSIDGQVITYHNEADVAFQFASVDTGESISFSDVLKTTYDISPPADGTNPSGFNSSASEIPKVPSERVTPFGFDSPIYTDGICYPPYTTSSPDLKPTVILDQALYATGGSAKPANHFDVFWGNHTFDEGLSGPNFLAGQEMKLNITEKLEFGFADPSLNIVSDSPAAIVQPASGIQLNFNNYSHRLKIELPIFKVDPADTTDAQREATAMVALDEDVYVHIGDQSKVKDVYYLFVNGRNDIADAASGNLPGLQG